jgi:DNA-binding transcriptional LysR family regulator
MEESLFHEVFPLLYSKTLETFLIVCQQRSFTKAASVLGLSQSAVSQNILRLEEALGVTLFVRDVRPIMLTPEATVLKEQLEIQFSEMAITVAKIREQNALKPVVRVGVVESLSPNLAPELVRVLSSQANRISVLTGTSNVIVEDLLKRDVDLIVSSDPFNEIEGITRYFVFEEPHVLILPTDTGTAKREWSWDELQYCGLPFVRYAHRSSSGKIIESHLGRLRLTLPARFEADTSRVVFSLVAAGIGWALTTPLCLLQCEDMVARMRVLPAPEPVFSREIYVVTRKGENGLLAEAVTDICVAQLRQTIVPALVGIAPWVAPHLAMVAKNRIERVPVT